MTIELVKVSVYKSKSILDPDISEIGNNFLLNEPIMEGKINPYDLHWNVNDGLSPPVIVVRMVNNSAPYLHDWHVRYEKSV